MVGCAPSEGADALTSPSPTSTSDARTRIEQIDGALSASLAEDLIQTLNAGPAKGAPYLPTWRVIEQANRVFGYSGWSFALVGTPSAVQKFQSDGKAERTLYTAVVRVEAHGRNATDIGTCMTTSDAPESHEMAIKGAVSDGMRRAFRSFGPQFGNQLYDKEDRTPADREAKRKEAEAAGSDAEIELTDQLRKLAADDNLPRHPTFSNSAGFLTWAAAMHLQAERAVPSERDVLAMISLYEEADEITIESLKEIGQARLQALTLSHLGIEEPPEADDELPF